jgi:hypothetical protein
LGAVAFNTPRRKDKKRKKKTSRSTKKRLYIFIDHSKLAFNGLEEVAKPWNFNNYETYIEWYHISQGFPHHHYELHRKANKANLHCCEWPIFKELYIEMCQHIYNTPFLERNECLFSILRMVYAEVVLGK